MAIFEKALPYILRHEGGWADDPDDPGGATNQGITLAVAQRHGIPDKAALRAITPEQVAAIYDADYWRFNGLVDQRVATKIFDMSVNMGRKMAVRLTQEVLNDLGAGLDQDGSYGPLTEQATNAVNPDRMLELLCMVSAEHYKCIVDSRPQSAKFLKGWLIRASEVPRV
jgi:lysozyme family protein